jgi:serine/threonine protein phosphatase 1
VTRPQAGPSFSARSSPQAQCAQMDGSQAPIEFRGGPQATPLHAPAGFVAEAVGRDLATLFARRGPPVGPTRIVTRFRATPTLTRVAGERLRPRSRSGPPTAEERSTGGALVYAVGDVHGRYDLLLDLLGRIDADQAARSAGRTPILVMLGDYVDRGPQSAQVLETLSWLRRRAPFEVVALNGNHEQGMLQFLEAPDRGAPWLRWGGTETLASYGVAAPDFTRPDALLAARDMLLDRMPASHLRLLQDLDTLAAVGDYLFVHAGLAPGVALEKQVEADLLWIRDDFLGAPRPSDRIVVHGHTWVDAEPRLLAQRIGVDTGAYDTGVLTALRLDGAQQGVLQALDAAAQASRAQRAWPGLGGRPTDFRQTDLSVNLRLGRAGSRPGS